MFSRLLRHSLVQPEASVRCTQVPASHIWSRLFCVAQPASDSLNDEVAAIRDFAVIAHVDHGKTTLMDRLLAHCGHGGGEERFMDSNTLEKERGITITSKYTALNYKGHILNAVDTPGHADFGGEVERVLGMVDGCLLLVDPTEGPLAQTKFVLGKALARGLRPIVVFNKVDRPAATPQRCEAVETQLFDMFASLGACDEQLDFPLFYASAKQGWACPELPGPEGPPSPSLSPLLDAILSRVPPPALDPAAPFSMAVAMTEHDPFCGKVLTGRVHSGSVVLGDAVKGLRTGSDGPTCTGSVTKLFKRIGTGRMDLKRAVAGDIVSVCGLDAAHISDTIGAPGVAEPLPPGQIDPPTLSMVFGPNTSPFAGRSGKQLTSTKIMKRLQIEADNSVALRVGKAEGAGEAFEVQARGELQLGLLLETMRREGFELSVSPPKVLLRRNDSGKMMEPIEDVVCEVPASVAGGVIEMLSRRKGELTEMASVDAGDKQQLSFTVPSRGMLGLHSTYATLTSGEGIMQRAFRGYDAHRGPMDQVRKGALVSTAQGKTTTKALCELQSRGTLFIAPGTEAYEGMVIGEHSRDDDLDVNPAREKALSNVRTAGREEKMHMSPARQITLEEAIGYVNQDELIEVTPTDIRMRKVELDTSVRKQMARSNRKSGR